MRAFPRREGGSFPTVVTVDQFLSSGLAAAGKMMAQHHVCNSKDALCVGFRFCFPGAGPVARLDLIAAQVMPSLSNSHPMQAFKPTRGGSHLHGGLRLPLMIKGHVPTHLAIFAGKCKSIET